MRDRVTATVERIPPVARAIIAIAAFAGVAIWLTVTTWSNLSSSRLDIGPLTDFRDAIYYPLVALRDGINPYAVESYYRHYPVGQEFPLYTPIHLVLHAPLLLFSFPVARAVAFGWNLALVLGYAVLVLRLLAARLTLASVFGLGTLILLSDPGKFDLRTGQPTLMIVIALLLALRAVASTRSPRSDGAGPSPPVSFVVGVVGIAVVWSKPTFAIPLVVLLVARARSRLAMVGTAVAVGISALVLPLLVDAAGGFGHLFDSWQDSARITSRSSQSRLGSGLRIDAANAFVRITHLHPSEGVATVAGLLLLVAGAWVVHRLHRHDPASDREELVLALVCLLVLTSMYHVPYDYLLLVAPVAMLLRPRPTHAIAWPRRARAAVVLMLLVPLVDPLGWSPVNAVLGKSGFEWMFGPTMISSFVLASLGVCAWTAIRQLRDAPVAAPTAPLEAAP
jgi:hypothetical protein